MNKMSRAHSAGECANSVREAGGQFFIFNTVLNVYGTGDCVWEKITSADCKGNGGKLEVDEKYDFYSVTGKCLFMLFYYNLFVLVFDMLRMLRNKDDFLEPTCTTLHVGGSEGGRNTKTKSIGKEYICPSIVDKDNWLEGHTYGDTFSVEQTADKVIVKRTDKDEAWGMDLKFKCCRKGYQGR